MKLSESRITLETECQLARVAKVLFQPSMSTWNREQGDQCHGTGFWETCPGGERLLHNACQSEESNRSGGPGGTASRLEGL